MKQKLAASTLIAFLAIGAQPVTAQESSEVTTYRQEWQGMGIGALVGTIAGGPPGFIIGAAGGGLIGRHQGLEGDLKLAQQEIAKLISLRQKSESALKTHTKQLEVATTRYEKQLDAIVQGFALNLQFRTESAELEPHFKQQLEQVINLLLAFPELSVHVHAHADRRGTDRFNQTLTQRRAHSVVRHLRAAGIRAGRIRKLSLGESKALYPLSDGEGMDFDRRVQLYLCRS